MCSVFGCSKCPLNEKCYFSIRATLAKNFKEAKEAGRNRIVLILDRDTASSSLVGDLKKYLFKRGFKTSTLYADDFAVRPDELIWELSMENVYTFLYFIWYENVKKQIFSILELLEAGKNIVVLSDKKTKLWKKLGIEAYYIEDNLVGKSGKLKKEILDHIKKPSNNIYIVTYPDEIEKALDSLVLTLLDIPVNVSRRWLGLKVIEENKKISKKLERFLSDQKKSAIKKTLEGLWDKLNAPPSLYISLAKEKLINSLLGRRQSN